jgi:hypothetical protein
LSDRATLFDLLRAMREAGKPFGPLVDEAALAVAQQCRDEITRDLRIALPYSDWTRFTAILQKEIAKALRHAAFDAPAFPANRQEDGDWPLGTRPPNGTNRF